MQKHSKSREMLVRRETAGLLDRVLADVDVRQALPSRMENRTSRQRNGHSANGCEDLYWITQAATPAGRALLLAWFRGVVAEASADDGLPDLFVMREREELSDGDENVGGSRIKHRDDLAGIRAWRERLEAHLPDVELAIAVCRREEARITGTRMPPRSAHVPADQRRMA